MLSSASRILLCCAGLLGPALAVSSAETPSFHVVDLEGHVVESLLSPGVRVIVLIFAATDCPISNRYIPEVTKLEHDLSSQGVRFWWVFPNAEDTPVIVRKHAQQFQISTPTLIDARQQLVRMAHVAVTPESAVFMVENGGLREVYHGRIDDRYIAFGKEHPQAIHHDLDEAIKATLAGHPVSPANGKPIGCSIISIASAQR
jgi:hypothetical protein